MGGLPDWRDLAHAEKVKIVRDFAEKGISGSQIAENFVGATRAAVLGFCRRNGIRLKRVPVHPLAPAEKPRPRKKSRLRPELNALALFVPEQPPEGPVLALASASTPMVYMAAIDTRRCLWPLWDRFEGPFVSLCCGAERVAGRPYCEEHVLVSEGRS